MNDISAFGIEHTEIIFKAKEPPASQNRKTLATVFGPYHSAVAAKKRKKVQATARSLGYGFSGNVVGAGVGAGLGAVTRKPAAVVAGANAGALGGVATGNHLAFKGNNKRGYYKKEQ